MESSVQKHAKQIEGMRERLLSLERYSREYNLRFHNGGGVTLYLKSSLEYHLRNDLKIAGVENIWVDTQDLLIGVIYNPPSGSQRDFIDEFENVLHSVFLSKRKCLILGDFNINELCRKWLTTRNTYYHKQYKIYRNKIVSINKALRTLYYDSVLKDSTKTKKMWIMLTL